MSYRGENALIDCLGVGAPSLIASIGGYMTNSLNKGDLKFVPLQGVYAIICSCIYLQSPIWYNEKGIFLYQGGTWKKDIGSTNILLASTGILNAAKCITTCTAHLRMHHELMRGWQRAHLRLRSAPLRYELSALCPQASL